MATKKKSIPLTDSGIDWNSPVGDFTPIGRDSTAEQVAEEPAPRGTMRALADTGLSFGRGAVQGVRMLTDVAGADNAVSGGLRGVEDFLGGLQSAQAKGDQAEIARILKDAEGQGVLDQVKAGLQAIAVAPGQVLAQAAGTSVPTMLGAAIPGVGPAAVAARFAAPVVAGAAQGVGTIKGSVYDEVKRSAIEAGATPEEAEARAVQAQSYDGPNAGQIALGGGLGAVAGKFGIEGTMSRLVGGAKGAVPGIAGRVAMGAVSEAAPEFAQGAQEKFATNTALTNDGTPTDPWSGVVAGGTMEAAAGGLLGGALGIPKPSAAAEIRAKMVPEIGPMTRGLNAAMETQAQAAEASGIPATGEQVLRGAGIGEGAQEENEAARTAAENPEPAPDPLESRREALTGFLKDKDVREQIRTQLGSQALTEALYYLNASGDQSLPPGTAERMFNMADSIAQSVAKATIQAESTVKTDETAKTDEILSAPSDGAMAPVDEPAAVAQRKADRPAAPAVSPIQPDDILTKSGGPFRNMPSAMRALSQAGDGFELARVAGGLVVRKSAQGSTNAGAAIDQRSEPIGQGSPGVDQPIGQGSGNPVTKIDQGSSPAAQAKTRPQPTTTGPAAIEARPAGTRGTTAADLLPKTGPVAKMAGKAIDPEWSAFTAESGTKGIPRADMPQIKAEHRGAMVQFLKGRGITHEQESEVDAATLKPTQAEFSPGKVAKARGFEGGDRAILVSSDNHVLDGHHQWVAALADKKPVRVIRLDAPIDALLADVKEFPSATTAVGATAPTAAPAAPLSTMSDASMHKQWQDAIARGDRDGALVIANRISAEKKARKAAEAQPTNDTNPASGARAEAQTEAAADQAPAPARSDAAAPASVPAAGPAAVEAVGVAPSPKKRTPAAAKAAANRAAKLADYFTPGNVVGSYSGHDRVISFLPPDEDGRWSVKVRSVIPKAGKWVDNPNDSRERQHATEPGEKELKAGPTVRATPKPSEPEAKKTFAELAKESLDSVPGYLGRNTDGEVVYEDKRGVRSILRDGVRITESVAMRPTRDGVKLAVEHKGEYLTVEEAAPAPAATSTRPVFNGDRQAYFRERIVSFLQPGQYGGRLTADRLAEIGGDPEKAALPPREEIDTAIASLVKAGTIKKVGRSYILANKDEPAAAPKVSANTVFTEDAAAAARARLKAKLGRVQSGLDPETMMDGITLAGYHIEKGARTFAAYARAMVDDLGDGVKPYLQSWYMATRADPRAAAFKSDMDKASAVEDLDIDEVLAAPSEDTEAGPVVIPASEEAFAEALGQVEPADGAEAGDVGDLSDAINQANGEADRYNATFKPAIKPVSLPRTTSANPKPEGVEFLSPEQAAEKVAEWKAEAARQGKTFAGKNGMRTVISLFDASGVLAQPWHEAGYNVVAYDLQTGADISEFNAENLLEQHGNDEVWAILAQPPCTDFASSGAQWWKDKDADGRTEASNELVRQVLRTVELFRPPVWVMENPVGRIAKLNKLPEPTLSFDPWNFGDPYTKRTLLWGKFQNNLPTAPVEPVDGSKMHRMSSSAKYERSLTSEPFAYALFMANNAEAMPLGSRLAAEFAGVDAALFDAAVQAGKSEQDIRTAIEDSYYENDLDYVREQLADMAPKPTDSGPDAAVDPKNAATDTPAEDAPNDSTPSTPAFALDQQVAGRPETEPVTRGAASPRKRAGRSDAASVRGPRGRNQAATDGQRELGDGGEPDGVPAGTDGAVAGGVRRVPAAPDFRPEPGGLTREGSWFATAARNIDLIELAIRIEGDKRPATPEEQAQLSKYVGFGASEIRNALFPVPSSYAKQQDPDRLIWPNLVREARWKPLAERMEALPIEWQRSVLQSSQYAHYTSEGIIRSVWSGMQRLGFTGGKVLEPGMGIGSFAMLMPENVRATSKYTGVEFDGPTALIAQLLSPEQNMLHDDFIKRKFPRDYFDVAVGNPPFSQTKILGDPDYEKFGFMLHDFFFAKSLDRVRPGGLLVFVTSKGTMDKQTDKARKYMADRADLLGAIRLPSTAFEANAGTSVVTDVIFLRKRAPGEAPGGQPWQGLKTVETKDGPTPINEYFADHPDMVLGQNRISGNQDDEGRRINSNGMGGEKYTVVSYDKTPAELDAKFAKAIERLPANAYSPLTQTADQLRKETAKVDFDPLVKREGVIYTSKSGVLMRVENGVGRPLDALMKMQGKDEAWFKGYVGIRDMVQLARAAQANDGDWEAALKALNKAYDAFRKTHGPVNDFRTQVRKSTDEEGNPVETEIRIFKNRRLFREDYDAAIVTQLETINEAGEIVKAPFLKGRTIGKPVTREVKTIGDALAVSLDENGSLNLDDVARRMSVSRDEAIDALGSQVYQTPAGQWQLSDEYLSGDVVAKLEEAEIAARLDPKLERNIEALKAVQPEKLGPSQISVKAGASWVPAEHVNAFAREIGAGAVTFDPKTESWQVEGGNMRSERKAGAEYGTADRSPSELLESVLNSQSITIKRTVDKKTETDANATTAANEAARKIKDKFKSWIWTDSDRASELVESYNKRFNNIAPRRFDGSHMTLPGVSLRFKLHPHQKRAIWRQVQTGNTYLAHAVGAGKTIEMIAGGMEQKRLGLIKKPVYVVPNHMLEQFSNEFMELYPLANVMVADDENFSAERRKAFVAAATLNAPDAIVITHSAFERIGVKEETIAPIRDDLLLDLQMELDDAKGDRVRRSQLEQQIEAVTQRFDSIAGVGKKDSTIKFEDIGADFVYVDEAHAYRKLDFTTNQKIKGIDPNGSRRALDMYVKTRHLEKMRPGRAMAFASGTPVTNTMGELYTIMRFFSPDELAGGGISTFDAWSRQFGEAVPALEANAAGRYEVVERFAKFDNVPELMSRVRQFMDVLTSEHLGSLVKRPDIEGGKPDLITVEPTEALKRYMKTVLLPRLERSRKWKPSKDEPFNPDPVIAITSDGRFAALDPRFFGEKIDEDKTPTKLVRMADEVARVYAESKDNTYTDKDDKTEAIKGSTQIVFYNLGFGKQSAANRGFDARAALTRRMVSKGVKRDHILWFDDADTDAKKEAMFKAMRSGEARVLIGSAKKMGTGVNVQKRLLALHYFDPPWYPSDVEQPHGRIIRQGNQNAMATIKWYATKGTYDATMWQMVGRKQRFIDQAFSGDKSLRSMEDMSEASMFEQAAAVASGDPRALQLAGLRQDVERFERLQAAHASEQINVRGALRSAMWGIETYSARVKQYEAAFKAIGGAYYSFRTGTVGSRSYEKPGEFGQALKDAFNKGAADAVLDASPQMRELGNLPNGVTLRMEADADKEGVPNGNHELVLRAGKLDIQIAHGPGMDEQVDAVGLYRRVVNAVNGIEGDLTRARDSLLSNQNDERRLRKKLGAPFEYQQELAEKYGELKRLETELREEGEAEARAAAAAPPPIAIDAEGNTPPAAFSRTDGDRRASMRSAEITKLVAQITSRWANAPEVLVADSMQDPLIPAEVRTENSNQQSQGATGNPEGFFHAGKVYLLADQLAGDADVVRVLFHEALGHYGLRGTFGKELGTILDRLAVLNQPKVRSKAKQYGLDYERQGDRRTAAEEVLAEMAQNRPELGWVKRAIAAIRSFLRAHVPGFARMKMTDDEIVRGFIMPARHFVEQGAATPADGDVAFSRSAMKDIDANVRRGEAAMNRAIVEKADQARAMFRSGLGWVDFVWGDTKRGIAHIIDQRMAVDGLSQDDAVRLLTEDIVRTIAEGSEIRRNKFGPSLRVVLEFGGSEAVLVRRNGGNGWLLTGFKVPPGGRVRSATQSQPTQPSPIRSRQEPVAGSDGSVSFSRSPAEVLQGINQESIRNAFLDATTSHGSVNAWAKTVGTQYDKAQRHPKTFGRVFNEVQDYIKDISVFANAAADLAPSILPKLDSWRDVVKRDTSKADLDAVGAVIFQGTLDKELLDRPALLAKGLTEKQADLYDEFRAAVNQSLDDTAKTEIVRLAGADGDMVRSRVLGARTASRAAEIMSGHLREMGQDDAADMVEAKAEAVDRLKSEGYAPLMRFGQHTVHVHGPLGTEFFGMYESRIEANTMARKLRGDPEFDGMQLEQGVMSQESYKLFAGLSVDSLELFASVAGDTTNPVYQDFLRLTKNNRSALKRLIQRNGTAGFSTDTGRVLASFVTSNSRLASGNLHLGQAKAAANDIPREQGDLKDEAVRLVDYVQNPQEEAQAVRGLLFTTFIGGSVASAMVNMTQPFTMTLPYLSQFGGLAKAGAQLLAAAKIVASGKPTGALARALKRAESDGIVSPQEIHHLQAATTASLGNHPMLKKAAFVWGSMFSLAEQFNRRLSFIAAYQMATDAGMADPFGFAEKAVIETQGLYNKGNKANWARGAIGATAMTFKQFSTHYIEWLTRMYQSGPEGKRAAITALAILMLMGGAGGLPFADDLDDIIDTLAQAMGYDFNSKTAKRKFIAETLGLGDDVAEVATRGITALPGFPMDLSLRMGMGNLLPATGILLRSNTDRSRDLLEVAGAAGGLAKMALDGGQKLLQGDPLGAGKAVVPLAIQNIIKSVEMWDTGEYRNQKGAKVTDVDGIDAGMKSLGFQPAEVARESAKVNAIQRTIQLAKNVETEIAGAMAQARLDGDIEAEQAARQSLADWNRKNPETPIRIRPADIVRRVREMRSSRSDRLVKSAPKELRATVREGIN